MKTTLNFLAISYVCMLVMGACGNKSKTITVTGKNGIVYESYQEACSGDDFAAAYRFIDRMKAARFKSYEINDARVYVFKKEFVYLLAMMDESADKRAMLLWNENIEFISYWNEDEEALLNAAIELDREYVVERLVDNNVDKMSEDELLRSRAYFVKKGKDDFVEKIDMRLSKIREQIEKERLEKERLNSPTIPIELATTNVSGDCGDQFQIVKEESYALIKKYHAETHSVCYELSFSIKRIKKPEDNDRRKYVYAYLMDEKGSVITKLVYSGVYYDDYYPVRVDFEKLNKNNSSIYQTTGKITAKELSVIKKFKVELIDD